MTASDGASAIRHCAIYRRVSTDQQIEGFSLDHQSDVLVRLAESRGWTWEDFEDAGRSGESLDGRPAMAALITRLDEFDAILVVDDSRLARDELVAALIRDKLRSSDTKLITPSGIVDLNDPQSRFVSGVIALASQLEQNLRTRKMQDGHRRTAKAGFTAGGPPPFGYRHIPDPEGSSHKVLEIREDEARVLRLAISLVLDEHLSVYKATQRVNALRYVTRSGRPWDYRNLLWQLKKELISGINTYNSSEGPISYEIPAIIDRPTWERLQKTLEAKRIGKPRKNNLYPLTGHFDCACGGRLSGFPRPNGRSYKCSRNKAEWGDQRCDQYPRFHDAEQHETTVWREVAAVITDGDYLTSLLDKHLADIHTTHELQADEQNSLLRLIAEKRQIQVTITRTYADEGLDATVVIAAVQEIAAEIKSLEERIARADHWRTIRTGKASAVEALHDLAHTARERLRSPSLELMKELFDLLELRALVGPSGLQVTGTIPVCHPAVGKIPSELGAEDPQARAPPPQRCGPAAVSTLLSPGLAG